MTITPTSYRAVQQQMDEFDRWLHVNWTQFYVDATLDNVPLKQIAAMRSLHERQRPAWRAAHFAKVCADVQPTVH